MCNNIGIVKTFCLLGTGGALVKFFSAWGGGQKKSLDCGLRGGDLKNFLFIIAIPEDGVREESDDEEDSNRTADQRISSMSLLET